MALIILISDLTMTLATLPTHVEAVLHVHPTLRILLVGLVGFLAEDLVAEW